MSGSDVEGARDTTRGASGRNVRMLEALERAKRPGLSQLAATAICGNDITSSCLYVSAIAIIYAGKWAPVALLMVAGVLFLFRSIYAEVVGALPLNGGAYNALLNTTSKYRASVAACLTILSYMATAVISASEAMHYIRFLWEGLPLIAATIALLAVFLVLTIIGITESSRVAIAIFLTHLAALTLLVVVGIAYIAANGIGQLEANLRTPTPGGFGLALFFGFCAAMLGVSGFESSANFVEEQAEGVFPKTLRNMWVAVTIFNPIMALLALALVPIGDVDGLRFSLDAQAHQGALENGVVSPQLRAQFKHHGWDLAGDSPAIAVEEAGHSWHVVDDAREYAIEKEGDKLNVHAEAKKEALLAHMGKKAGGTWLYTLICLNAALVLSGAVLTSFVGVNGLVRRLTLDRCLPQFLLKTNRRGTTHRILIGFFLLAVSILLITKGKLIALAGVYTLSFLAVMALFGLGNVLLKVRRSRLPRPTRAAWPTIVIGILAVLAALVGNALMHPKYVLVFLEYFIPAMVIVSIMLGRIALLKSCLYAVRVVSVLLHKFLGGFSHALRDKIEQINAQQVVFFTRGDNVANLNTAMMYVQANEHTNRIKVVTVVKQRSDVPPKLERDLQFLDEAYPAIDIDFVVVEGAFSPKLIRDLSHLWDIPTNLMFIGSPGGGLPYGLAELHGVRLVI